MTIDEKLKEIKVTWKTLPYPEIKRRLQTLYHDDMSFLDLVSALYWDLIETKHKYAYDSVKFGNNMAALEEIKELKKELNGWQDNPFGIIAECCEQNSDCTFCHWFEKCPYPKSYTCYPEEWGGKYDN